MHPQMTTRERVSLQTRSATCQNCHSMINPLGFSLENFDAVGRFRTREGGRPIDASGAYETRAGRTVRFVGPRELAEFLAASDQVHRSFAEQLFRHVVKQPVQAYGADALASLQTAFAESDYNVPQLLVAIMRISARRVN
jgi:hypothetical protein